MDKKEVDIMSEVLGFEPSKEMRLLILNEVKESGKSIAEVAGKRAMPPMFSPDENGLVTYKGEKMTMDEFHKRYPYSKSIVIKRRTNNL